MHRSVEDAVRGYFGSTAWIGLMVVAAAPYAAAQSVTPDRNLMFNPASVRQTPAPQAAAQHPQKPKAKSQATATKRTPNPPAQRTPAALARTAQPQVKPVDPRPQLGRVPFENGSLGLSTDKSYRTTVFSDGRVTPGFENVQTKDPAYVGFSLSVPTEKNSIFPLPLLRPQD